MSVKKSTQEEKLSQSIFYNLNILKLAVKSSAEFDENFSNTMFMKSNTKAFIHITHYLFNIIDSKEFRAKFYWPITEKKYENSYRSSSIEFINNLIDKHSLAHEKIKIPFVVHPCGKKFLSLILDLIMIALKEVMKRRKLATEASIEIEKTEEVCANMKQIENEMVTSINSETKAVRARVASITDLLSQIYSTGEHGMAFEDFVRAWHEFNKARLTSFKNDSSSMELIFEDMENLKEKARDMLTPKTFEPFAPAVEECRDLVDYYEDDGAVENLDLQWYLAKLHQVLPTIHKFVAEFSVDPANVTAEELRVIKKFSLELEKIETKTEELRVVLKTKVARTVQDLKRHHEEQKRLEDENQSPEKLAEVKAMDEMELEKLKASQSPSLCFDATKNCVKHVAVRKIRLALLYDDGKVKDDQNESKMYRSMRQPSGKKMKPNQTSRFGEMAPPSRPSSRRRLDAMELLERATSNHYDLNSSRHVTGVVPKRNLKAPLPTFSSTMLSPHFRPDLLDCSSISAISKASPVIDTSLDSTLEETMQRNSSIEIRKTQVPFAELATLPIVSTTEATLLAGYENSENSTVKQNGNFSENSSGKVKSGDSLDLMRMRLVSDEDLFNISDTVLQEVEE